MADLQRFAQLASQVDGLAVISTARTDGSIQCSLVNVGVLASPLEGEPVLAFVTYGKVKLANLRRRPQLSATVVSGWQWATIEGNASIIGPDDPHPDIDAERLRQLLREIFSAAGGTHDNWAEYDTTMLEQRRAAVLVAPSRTYGN